jgi:hydrogenase expression/formation protein HypE
VPDGIHVSSARAEPGDLVLVNGTIGEHGLAILSLREGIDFGSDLKSDAAPLSKLIVPLLGGAGGIKAMRDATRGGLAAVLNEIATDSGVCINLEEAAIPVSAPVRAGCELMGYDPLHIANEGKFVAIVSRERANDVLEAMRGHELGREASVIGEVLPEPAGHVILKTALGGERVVDVPYGDLLPRIC